ncbi:MAG: hypothetical protein ABIO55_12550 [Ginsengibacter sp.]
MSWGERVQNIYRLLNEAGFKDVVDQMIEDYAIGGTPGEMFSIVCVWLAKMRNRNREVYKLVKEDADKILEEGIQIKYFTERYYRSL